MSLLKSFLLSLTLSAIWVSCSASRPNSFEEAKKIASKLFKNNRVTLYCSCQYSTTNIINLASCNMQSAEGFERAHRVEWEHMMPAEFFGHNFPCWQQPLCKRNGVPYKGRECCQAIDARFRSAEAELYNLWPAVGLVNLARSDYHYGTVKSHNGFYGCDFQISKLSKKAEPADYVKGLVARATLFMADTQKIKLTPAELSLYKSWDKQFPPTSWERVWAGKVAVIEGYSNPYIDASN